MGNWWYKTSQQSVNLWKLSRSSNVPKRPGAKSNQRQPRKSKNKVPVLTHSEGIQEASPHATVQSQQPVPVSASDTSVAQSRYDNSLGNCYSRYRWGFPYPPPIYPPPLQYATCIFTTDQPSPGDVYHNSNPFVTPPPPTANRDACHNSNPFVAVIRAGNVSKCTSCGGKFPRSEQVVFLKAHRKAIICERRRIKSSVLAIIMHFYNVYYTKIHTILDNC